MARLSIGIDVGGTFTDATIVDEIDGKVWTIKTPSTPDDPSVGLMDAVGKGLTLAEANQSELHQIVHGTTVATNALLERKPTNMVLVTTAGFRSVLEIGRHDIPPGESYYGWIKPERPVTPDRIFEIPERVTVEGEVLHPLDEAACRAVAKEIRDLGVESIAVCFLHAYLHPNHERRAAEILAEECPGAWISTSSEVLPQFREYERSMATVLNAYVTPHVSRYLGTINNRLAESKMDDTSLYLMKANGGVIGVNAVLRQAIQTSLSGPAGGVIGATRIAKESRFPNIITIDVGGTSADVSLVENSTPMLSTSGQISDFPLQVPVVDIETIGAGGGSIASLTDMGQLNVGPKSAGADPGPVCYGKGGTEPTVTDAHLVLGRIEDRLLDGEVTLDRKAAEEAIIQKVAEPLGLKLEEAAQGILGVLNASMVGAIRSVSIERGHDPRDFALMPFGGAGPLHGVEVAKLLGIPQVIVPRNPGVLSTYGLLGANWRNDFVRTVLLSGPDYPMQELEAAFTDLENEARELMEVERLDTQTVTLERSADLRFQGQGSEIPIPVPDGPLTLETLKATEEAFREEHYRLYSYTLSHGQIELVNLRITAQAPLPTAPLEVIDPQDGPVDSAIIGHRDIYHGLDHGWISTPCFNRSQLGEGATIVGPAVFQQLDSTTVLGPDEQARVDKLGNLIVKGR